MSVIIRIDDELIENLRDAIVHNVEKDVEEFFSDRQVVEFVLKKYLKDSFFSSGSEWNNNAALGYFLLAAKELNIDDKLVSLIERKMMKYFDLKSVEEAKDFYVNS